MNDRDRERRQCQWQRHRGQGSTDESRGRKAEAGPSSSRAGAEDKRNCVEIRDRVRVVRELERERSQIFRVNPKKKKPSISLSAIRCTLYYTAIL